MKTNLMIRLKWFIPRLLVWYAIGFVIMFLMMYAAAEFALIGGVNAMATPNQSWEMFVLKFALVTAPFPTFYMMLLFYKKPA